MKYRHVYINAISYVLPDQKVSTRQLEEALKEVYEELGIPLGQLESLSNIKERRYWPSDHRLSDHAAKAAKEVLKNSDIKANEIEMLIYAGVGRDQLEPATACAVAHDLGVSPRAKIFDISNACLGMLNGILQVADAIELGHIKIGLVVSAESAREIIDTMTEEIKKERNIQHFMLSLTTLTGGSGASAILLSNKPIGHRLCGGVIRQESKWHELCLWGPSKPFAATHSMKTDAIAVLKNGISLAKETYQDFLLEMPWNQQPPSKFICHQVGEANQLAIRKALLIPSEKDFTTYQTLANMGTVALPITAALASEVGFLTKGDRVGFLGIGSGLNCIMLGLEW